MKDAHSPPPELEFEDTDPTRKIIGAGLLIVLLFFVMGGTWISMAEISGAVIAPGEVKVATERKTIQHLEGGIVRQILVENGSKVKAGQPLLELESTRIQAGVEQLRIQLVASSLELARLEAERQMSDVPRWSKIPEGVTPAKFKDLLENETKVFSSRRSGLNNQIGLLGKQIEQLDEQELSLGQRLSASQEIIDTLQEELDAKVPLLEEHFIDKTAILSLRRMIADQRGQLAQYRGARAEVREKIAEYHMRISALKEQYQQEAIAKISDSQRRHSDLEQQLRPLIDANQRLTISAPLSGEVVALNVHSVNGVIAAGQALLDIVPENSRLIVQCQIQVKDITQVHNDQDADVQLLAFSQRTTPMIPGKVVYVSADRLVQNTPAGVMLFYVVHVALDKNEIEKNNLYLTAGMPVTVFIKTAPRTVLDYLIEPIKVRFPQAMRETQ